MSVADPTAPYVAGDSVDRSAATSIVYRCGAGYANLCRVSSAGTARTRLTNDGISGTAVCSAPSLSPDGQRLAFTFGGREYVSDGQAAPPPDEAEAVYGAFCAALRDLGLKAETGVFGARMTVEIANEGPVTIILDV